jgi:hypothetical protein
MFMSPLLAKLYVKGSLKNTEGGFEFRIKNIIDSATLVRFGPILVDQVSYAPEALTLTQAGVTVKGTDVTAAAPIAIRAFQDTVIGVAATPLCPGAHRITVEALTREVGTIKFNVNESLTGTPTA